MEKFADVLFPDFNNLQQLRMQEHISRSNHTRPVGELTQRIIRQAH